MDEDFVRKILEQSLGDDGYIQATDANEVWEVFKLHCKDCNPDILVLIEQSEPVMKKCFFSTINVFMSIPKFLIHSGMQKGMAALVMAALEGNIKFEYQKIIQSEKK